MSSTDTKLVTIIGYEFNSNIFIRYTIKGPGPNSMYFEHVFIVQHRPPALNVPDQLQIRKAIG